MSRNLARTSRCGLTACAVLFWPTHALAGPPYFADDPVPTDFRHFEIYGCFDGIRNQAGTAGDIGVDFNYGGAPDLQLTAVLPLAFAHDRGGASNTGVGNIQLAAKHRFLRRRDAGWVLARQLRPALQAGAEVFHQTRAAVAARDQTAIGAGLRYDCSKRAHLLAYGCAGVDHAAAEHQYSWYLALLLAF